ncbi:hypothetical protein L915_10046, partial [Phytophthora nicotianae]
MALNECVGTLMFVKAVAEMDYVKKITDVGSMRYDGAGEKLAFEKRSTGYPEIAETYYEMEEQHPDMHVLTRYYATNAYHVDTS